MKIDEIDNRDNPELKRTDVRLAKGTNQEKMELIRKLVAEWAFDKRAKAMLWGLTSIPQLRNFLKRLYAREKDEVFQAPWVTSEHRGDCDDQSIIVGCWATVRKLDYGLVVLREPGQSAGAHITTYVDLSDKERRKNYWANVDGLPYRWPENIEVMAVNGNENFKAFMARIAPEAGLGIS